MEKRYGRGYVAHNVLADLVRDGWGSLEKRILYLTSEKMSIMRLRYNKPATANRVFSGKWQVKRR